MKKTSNSFISVISTFAVYCDILFYQFGIYTAKELRESPYYEKFFMAAYHLAEAMVNSPVHHAKIQSIHKYHASSDEDIIHDITLLLVEKYPKIVAAMINTGENHNHRYYVSQTVTNALRDINKKYTYETDKRDAKGKKVREHYAFSSLNNGISDDDDGCSFFIDLLEDEDPTPEEYQLDEDEKDEAICRILHYMLLAADHRYKGEVLSLVLFGLKGSDMGESINKTAQKLYSAGPENVSVLYKHYLKKYNREVLHLSEDELVSYLTLTNDDFGDIDMSSPDPLATKLSRWNYLLRHDLADFLDIDLSKKDNKEAQKKEQKREPETEYTHNK